MRTFRGRLPRIGSLALLFVISAAIGFAQTATITGRVTDSTEAVVPGTAITITNVATGATRTVQTNETGYYTVPLLPPAQYEILVEQDGFRPITQSGITLAVEQRAEINFVLEVGLVTEQIEVTADAPVLNTVEASQGQVIENQRIVDLPLNGRNYNQLALLSAGTVQPVGGRFGGFSVGGQRTTQNNFLLDGVDNNGVELAGAQRRSEMIQPSIDAIQEFKVQTNSYAAEYGRAMGAVVNVTTKSGTNQIHGTAFEFLRNENLDAKNFFDPANRPIPPFKRNQFGFSAGGPIYFGDKLDFRNKLFWFADYEGTRRRESRTATSTIPTVGMRTGDFTDLFEQRGRAIVDPDTGSPFPNNTIPGDRIDPVSQKLIDLYPQPQNGDITANFVNQSGLKEDVDKWDVKADVNITSNDNMFWRLSSHDLDRPQALTLPAPAFAGGNDQIVQGMNTATGWNHIWSPNLIMSIRAGWNFSLFKRDNPAAAGDRLFNEEFGIKGFNNTTPGGFSLQNITGYANVGIGAFNPVDRDSQNRSLTGDVNWTRGKHNLKFGGGTIRSQNNIFNIREELGTFRYNGRFSTDGMADFLLGQSSRYDFSTRLQVDLRQWLHSFYVQDDWKVTPRLTVNLGLRYELLLPWQDKRDRLGVFDTDTDPANPVLRFAGSLGSSHLSRAGYAPDKDNFMPRVGFAYKLTDKTVIRAGYGIYYAYMEPFGDSQYLIGNPPNAFGVRLSSSPTRPALLLSDGPPVSSFDLASATGVTFVSYERYPEGANAQQWNFNIQRELGTDWLWEVGYSGSSGKHLLRRYEGNFSPPGPGNVDAKRPIQSAEIPGTGIVTSPLGGVIRYAQDGNASYHALVSRLEKRFSSGYTVLLSYTYSKSIGDTCGNAAAGNTTGCGFQDIRNFALERSVDNQHVPQRLVFSALYELPFGRGRRFGSNWNGALDKVLGGWQVGSIVTAVSGRPFSAIVSGNPANTGTNAIVNRPNLLGDPDDFDSTVTEDFNTAVFERNADFTIGSAGRNILQQRSQYGWDFSLLKNTSITERLGLQFRFEAFQFTNTPRFGQAGNTVGTNNFGRITSAATARKLQFGLKLLW